MRNWRVVTAIAAVVLAAAAGVLVWLYVDDADERAERDQELVDVYVAAERVPLGTTGDRAIASGLVEVEERRRKDVPGSAVEPGDEEAIGDRFAASDIPAGQFIVREHFVESTAQTDSAAGLIGEGKQAISISVDDTHGVAGFVKPGDQVSVILSTEVEDLLADSAPSLGLTAYLLPSVKVLAVGSTTEFGPANQTRSDTNGDGVIDDRDEAPRSEPQQRGLITLEVTPRQAEQIAHAQQTGTTYLALHPPDFDPATFEVPEEIVELTNLFDQPLTRLDQVQELVRTAAP